MTELLNGRRFGGRAAGKGAAPPRTAPQRSGDIASRCPILRSSFGPNLDQIGRKRQSYGIFSVFGDGAGGQPSGRRIRAISSFPSIDTLRRSQKKFEGNRTINDRDIRKSPNEPK